MGELGYIFSRQGFDPAHSLGYIDIISLIFLVPLGATGDEAGPLLTRGRSGGRAVRSRLLRTQRDAALLGDEAAHALDVALLLLFLLPRGGGDLGRGYFNTFDLLRQRSVLISLRVLELTSLDVWEEIGGGRWLSSRREGRLDFFAQGPSAWRGEIAFFVKQELPLPRLERGVGLFRGFHGDSVLDLVRSHNIRQRARAEGYSSLLLSGVEGAQERDKGQARFDGGGHG